MPLESARRDSFVVRIWHEAGQTSWKGWVQHAGSGESTVFQRWNELHAFLQRWAGAADEPADAGLK